MELSVEGQPAWKGVTDASCGSWRGRRPRDRSAGPWRSTGSHSASRPRVR